MAELERGQNTLAFCSRWSYRKETQGENSPFKTDMHYQFCYRLGAKFCSWAHRAHVKFGLRIPLKPIVLCNDFKGILQMNNFRGKCSPWRVSMGEQTLASFPCSL